MFSDPLVALMVMVMLCFLGMLIMFLFVIRSITAQTQAIKDAERKQQSALADIEQHVLDIAFVLRRQKDSPPASGASAAPGGDLLSLLENMTPPVAASAAASAETAPKPHSGAEPQGPRLVTLPDLNSGPRTVSGGLNLRLDD